MLTTVRHNLLTTLAVITCLLIAQTSRSQVPDSMAMSTPPARKDSVILKDSLVIKKHSPKKAALRSAIVPGLGQIYNKKYWKLPIVYGALGVSGGIFFYNLKNYKATKFAYRVKYNMRVFHTDSASFDHIKDELKPLSEESLRYYRNQYRRDLDYAAIFFVVVWGLNIVDAAVDAHLKTFDVSPDLGLRIKPGYSEMAGTSGLSLVLTWKDKTAR